MCLIGILGHRGWICVTWTLEKGSMTLMRFCSSRLSYSLVRWVLMMGSSLSSALYSVSALRRKWKTFWSQIRLKDPAERKEQQNCSECYRRAENSDTHLFKVCQRPVLAGLCHTFQWVCLWKKNFFKKRLWVCDSRSTAFTTTDWSILHFMKHNGQWGKQKIMHSGEGFSNYQWSLNQNSNC